METQSETELKAEVAGLRGSYARLLAICGPRAISKETTQEYEKRIRALLARITLNTMSAGGGRQTTTTTTEETEK